MNKELDKQSIDLSLYEELFITSYLTSSLTYLIIVQSKKQEDIRYDTLVSYNYQYLIDEKSFSNKFMNKISDIDKKRRMISVLIINLKTLILSSETLRKFLEFDERMLKKYFEVVKYFDTYGIRFHILSIEKAYKSEKLKDVHNIEIDIPIIYQQERSEQEIWNMMSEISRSLNIQFKIFVNYLK